MKEPRTETQRRRGSGAVINEISETIVDRAVKIHAALGPGLLESVYQRILAYELRKAGLKIEIDESFRSDIIVNGQVLIALKFLP